MIDPNYYEEITIPRFNKWAKDLNVSGLYSAEVFTGVKVTYKKPNTKKGIIGLIKLIFKKCIATRK